MSDGESVDFVERDAILAAQDIDYEDVAVPEWGGKIRLRSLTSEDRDAFEASLWRLEPDPEHPKKQIQVRNSANGRAKLVALCAIHPVTGKLLFDKAGDVVLLGKKSGKALDRLFDVGSRISGLTPEAQEALGNGSGGTTGTGSNSASPESSAKPSES